MSDLAPFVLTVPATTANLGPGFDTLGMAVGLFNHFTVTPADVDRVSFSHTSTVETSQASINPTDSLFFTALNHYATVHGWTRPPVHVTIEAHIPLARGLGSSSTVIVAGLQAGAVLTGHTLTPEQNRILLPLAITLEGHPDNVAPALLRGVQCCASETAYPLPWPTNWRVLFMVPPYPLSTHQARQVMPKAFTLSDAVYNLGRTGLLVHALHTADPQAMACALHDRLHQPYRMPLISEAPAIRDCAIAAGAMGVVISGAGPTLAIFTTQAAHAGVKQALLNWINSPACALAFQCMDLPVLL
jgi:homoserine kinase